MDTNKLIATGLTKPQASAYALLIENGELTPPEAAKKLHLTRTNAYKLLDKLVELGLASKNSGSKSSYTLGNPMALNNLSSSIRAEVTMREEAIGNVMKNLVSKYYEHTEQPGVDIVSGIQSVADAFKNQIRLNEDIYFVRSRADITSMGFDTMHEIRVKPSRHGLNRYGILPDATKGPVNFKSYERTNLEATWVKNEDYDSPVEWSVTKSSLLIVLYGSEPHAITINNPIIASAFMQIWQLLSTTLKAMPYYNSLPRNT